MQSDIQIDSVTGDLVINTAIAMTKSLQIKAWVNGGTSISFIGLNVEVCGLETISVVNTTSLNKFYDRYTGINDI